MATRLVTKHSVKVPPVAIETIVAAEGYTIRMMNWPNLLHGVLVPESRIIAINRNDAPTRRRFSIAHELGHALLGHPSERAALATIDDEAPPKPVTYPRHLEQEANAFAAALLMPYDLLKLSVRTHRSAKALAQLFVVSEAAMVLTLERTKLVRALL